MCFVSAREEEKEEGEEGTDFGLVEAGRQKLGNTAVPLKQADRTHGGAASDVCARVYVRINRRKVRSSSSSSSRAALENN